MTSFPWTTTWVLLNLQSLTLFLELLKPIAIWKQLVTSLTPVMGETGDVLTDWVPSKAAGSACEYYSFSWALLTFKTSVVS